jgi:uncharacterized membrane protein (UPF0127 family)
VTRLVAALTLVAATLTVVVAPALGAATRSRTIGVAVRAASPAQPPFRGLTATTVHAGTKPLHVVIAKTTAQRERGLRQRSDIGGYDGMLFVFPSGTNVGFTMSTVPVPLVIGFYGSDGRAVDTLRMVPCAGTDATCPVYRARRSFRYALETLAGALPPGTLTG